MPAGTAGLAGLAGRRHAAAGDRGVFAGAALGRVALVGLAAAEAAGCGAQAAADAAGALFGGLGGAFVAGLFEVRIELASDQLDLGDRGVVAAVIPRLSEGWIP